MADFPQIDIWNEPSPFQNSQAYEQKNHNWDVLRNYGQYIGSYLKGITDGWDARFTAQLQQTPQPNEVIDARVSATGNIFSNLHDHIVNIEETKLGYAEANGIDSLASNVDPGEILKITDLSTDSLNLHYANTGTVAFELPRTGYEELKTTDLTINPD
ncbi:alpha-amylase [Limosilactobacillus pontis]|uniref:alpha-amylase n=1 Tax=Limosilactobacillus pontis TaxID=35787 RepID=UPI002F26D424